MSNHTSLILCAIALTTTSASAQILMTEIRTGGPGQDINDYVELRVPPGETLANLTYVVLGAGAVGGDGVIYQAIALDPVTPASGYFVLADSTFTLGVPDQVASLGFVSMVNTTHFLVSGFTGAPWQDLDTDDDGTLDIEPWASIVDSFSFYGDSAGLGRVYSPNLPDVDFSVPLAPDYVLRCPHGWDIFDSPQFVNDTPGARNVCGPAGAMACHPANVNSTGLPALLLGQAGPSTGEVLNLTVSQGPPQEFGYFLVGTGLNAENPIHVSNGLLCLAIDGGNLLGRYNQLGTDRFSVGQFDMNGELKNLGDTAEGDYGFDVPSDLPFPGAPLIQTGQTLHFQVWYRDMGATPTSNFTNVVTVWF